MGHWIRSDERSKCTKFKCPECGKEVYCICYTDTRKNVCDYDFCPRCGKPVKREVS